MKFTQIIALLLAIFLAFCFLAACDGNAGEHDDDNPYSDVSSSEPLVWIPTRGGVKYHKKETCSGMKDPLLETKSEAIRQGFTPCQKCYG